MKKDKSSDLKNKDNDKGVIVKSKNITKKQKNVNLETKSSAVSNANGNVKAEKKKLIQKENVRSENLSTKGSEGGGVPKKQKQKKKQKQNKGDGKETNIKAEDNNESKISNSPQKVLDEKDLAKIEKRKAKKQALKLKKQLKKAAAKVDETNKNEGNKEILSKVNNDKDNIKDVKTATEKQAKNAERKKKRKQKKENESETKEPKLHDAALHAATVFVGNLPVNTKRVQLVRLFEDYAPVNSIRFRTASGKVLFKHKHRKEAGSLNAWVVLKDKETAERALAINGTVFKNNHLRVTRVNLKNEQFNETDTKRTIFVGNLKYSANEDNLREIFSSCGDIEYVRCLRDGDKGCKGVAYVCFKTSDAVGLALELNETMLDERPIHVERYSLKKLGSKEARDNAAAIANKSKTGAQKRIDAKKNAGKHIKEKQTTNTGKEKKSKFRGVKVEGFKNKQKKKNVTSQMKKLANKIAPKLKST